MKKVSYRRKKAQQKKLEKIFIGLLAGALILVAVLTIVQLVTGNDGDNYTVTEDGHVHAADGTHVSTFEELLGADGASIVITEDGHLHAADGTHLGSLEELLVEEDEHDHVEGEE